MNRFLILCIFTCIFSNIVLADTKPVIQIDPIINLSQEKWIDALCQTIEDSISFTLRIIGTYDIVTDDYDVIESIDTAILQERCKNLGYDNIIYGSCSYIDEKYIISIKAYNLVENKITNSGSVTVESLFDTFDATELIVNSTINSLSGVHVTYGSLKLIPPKSGENYEIKINGINLDKTRLSINKIPSGQHKITVIQKRPYGIYEKTTPIEIKENITENIVIPLPYITKEEFDVLNKFDKSYAQILLNNESVTSIDKTQLNQLLTSKFYISNRDDLVKKYNHLLNVDTKSNRNSDTMKTSTAWNNNLVDYPFGINSSGLLDSSLITHYKNEINDKENKLLENLIRKDIAYGNLKITNSDDEQYKYTLVIDEVIIEHKDVVLFPLTTGSHNIKINQNRMFGDVTVFERNIIIIEKETEVLEFQIPGLTATEKEFIHRHDNYITNNWNIKKKYPVYLSINQAIMKLNKNSYSPEILKWYEEFEDKKIAWNKFIRDSEVNSPLLYSGNLSYYQFDDNRMNPALSALMNGVEINLKNDMGGVQDTENNIEDGEFGISQGSYAIIGTPEQWGLNLGIYPAHSTETYTMLGDSSTTEDKNITGYGYSADGVYFDLGYSRKILDNMSIGLSIRTTPMKRDHVITYYDDETKDEVEQSNLNLSISLGASALLREETVYIDLQTTYSPDNYYGLYYNESIESYEKSLQPISISSNQNILLNNFFILKNWINLELYIDSNNQGNAIMVHPTLEILPYSFLTIDFGYIIDKKSTVWNESLNYGPEAKISLNIWKFSLYAQMLSTENKSGPSVGINFNFSR